MTYRELHATLASTFDRSVDYLTLKAAVAKAIGSTNPLRVASAIRGLGQVNAIRCTESGKWWTVLPVEAL